MAIFSGIAALASTAFGSLFAGASFKTFLIKTVAQLAVSAIVRKLTERKAPDQSFGTSGKLQSGDDTPRAAPLGIGATEGSLVYASFWGAADGVPNSHFTQVIALSDLPVKGLLRVMIDGVYVTLATEVQAWEEDLGFGVVEYAGETQERYVTETVPGDPGGDGAAVWYQYGTRTVSKNYAWVKFYDGTQAAADPLLMGRGAHPEYPWNADWIGKGVAYAVVTARSNNELFSGFPRFKFVLDSVPLYDPSKDTSVGGDGAHRWDMPETWGGDGDYLPVVQAYNVMRGLSYDGKWLYGFQGMGAGRLPVAAWIEHIGRCRFGITGPSGPQPRYRAGGVLSFAAECGSTLEAIMATCAGRIMEIGGTYKPLVAGGSGATALSFTEDDITTTEGHSFTPVKRLADTINAVVAQYPEPEEGFSLKAAPPIYRSDLELEDAGRRLPSSVTLNNLPYADQVQRVMAMAIEEARRERRHALVLPPTFYRLEPGDLVEFTSEARGYEAKAFRVDAVSLRQDCHVMIDIMETDPTDYDFDDWAGYEPVDLSPVVQAPIPPAYFFNFFAKPTSIIDNSEAERRPAILVEWEAVESDSAAGAEVQVALASVPDAVTTYVQQRAIGRMVVSAGILPNTAYLVRGAPITSGPREWSVWVPVTTPDLRLSAADMADEVQDALTEAMAVRDAANARADEVLADATALVDGLRADVVGELAASIPRQIDTTAAVETLAERLAWLTLQLSQTRTDMADAGIYIDPDLGRARLEAVARIDTAISEVSLVLDAVQSAITLRATYSDVSAAITAAQLDPADLPEIEELRGRITAAELDLDAQAGAITAKADTITLDGVEVRVTTAELDIDSLEDEIALRVTTTTFDALETRVGSAEVTLGTIDAPSISLAVSDSRAARELTDDLAASLLRDILEGRATRQAAQADVAFARQDLTALVDEDRSSIATLRLDLGAAVAGSAAAVAAESTARATENAATAATVSALSSQVNNPTTGLPATRATVTALDTTVNTPTTGLAARSAVLEAEVFDPETGLAATRATVDVQQTALATIEGRAEVTYAVRLRAGGAAAGLEFVAADDPVEGPASAVRLAADTFTVNGDTFLEDAFIEKIIARQALISDLRVDTLMIKGGAVTVPVYLAWPGTLRPASVGGTTIAAGSIRRDGFATVITFGCQMGGYAYSEVVFSLLRNGVLINQWSNGTGPLGAAQSVFSQFVDTDTGTGVTNYRVDALWSGYAQAIITQRALNMVQTKR